MLFRLVLINILYIVYVQWCLEIIICRVVSLKTLVHPAIAKLAKDANLIFGRCGLPAPQWSAKDRRALGPCALVASHCPSGIASHSRILLIESG